MSNPPSLGPRGEGWVALQAGLLGALAAAGVAGLRRPAWRGPARLGASIVGATLVAAASVQAARGIRDLGRDNLTPLPHPTEAASLVETGIYARVRHPLYGSVLLGAAGWALLTGSRPALLLAVALVPFFRAKAAVEERWLERRFPGYPAYRDRTRRFIAGPG